MYFIGFDIGGSSIKAVLVKNKKIIKTEAGDLPGNFSDLLSLAQEMFEKLAADIKKEKIKGIGVSVAGVLNQEREKLINSPNILYLNNQPLKKELEQRFSCEVIIEHDVHCFLLAEKEIGLAKDLKNVFYLAIGTDIGSALMVDGKIYFGAHKSAGEAGQMIVEIYGQKLDFGEVASSKLFEKKLGISSFEAGKRVRQGDKSARRIFDECGRNLGIGIANIINIFDPEAIILAGGLMSAKELLQPGIEESIGKFVVSPEAKKAKILFSQLGRFGGALGAALLSK